MSSSKFANLEGVDFESPDVYETRSPSPARRSRNVNRNNRDRASQSSDEDSDEDTNGELESTTKSGRRGVKKVGGEEGVAGLDNPDIVGTALDPEEASKRFQKATGVDGRSVDFSSAIQKRKKRPQYYPPATFETTTYELGSGTGYRTSGGGHGPGDEEPWSVTPSKKELPIDKFRRLRFEMEELEKELKNEASAKEVMQSNGVDGKEQKEEGIPSGLMLELSTLRGQLSLLEDKTLQSDTSSTSWNLETRKLLGKLSLQGGESADEGRRRETGVKSGADNVNSGDGERLAVLDKRLAGLEDLIGVKDAMVDETKSLPRPLLPSLVRIEHLLTLLTHPRHLDGISRRIKVLVSELERLHEARRKLNTMGTQQAQVTNGDASAIPSSSSSQAIIPYETMQKLETVMPLLSKLEPMIPVVPALLARLHSLNALHTSSNTFVEDMNILEASMNRSQASNSELRVMLTNLEASLSENQKTVTSNLQVVEDRMENISQRVKKLQG